MEEAPCSVEVSKKEKEKARSLTIKDDVRTEQIYLTKLHCMKCFIFFMSGFFSVVLIRG